MSRSVRFFIQCVLGLIVVVLWHAPSTAQAADNAPIYPLYFPFIAHQSDPALTQFAEQVANGDGTIVRGLYADPTTALTVEQQPPENPMYVGTAPDTATQFELAEAFGVVGLLAHNTLAGARFTDFTIGQSLDLVYGDGAIQTFRVVAIKRYRTSDGQTFIDLDGGEELSVGGVFMSVYTQAGTLVLQTCLEFPGDALLGRWFVIAEPLQP